MNFDVITIFPDFFAGPLSHGMVFQAQKRGLIDVRIHDLRDFTTDRHRTVDDRPFGGGAGMVLKPEPLFRAIRKIQAEKMASARKVILLTPQGKRFQQRIAFQFSSLDQAVLICGRYEGVDERVTECLVDEELSIGDYVLSGGELAACVFVDAVTRLLPGVLNNSSSAVNESFATLEGSLSSAEGSLLDYPHYTRPEEFEGQRVPEVLLCGSHKRVELWRRKKALEKTLKNRPDLLQYTALSEEDKQLLG
ncbi:MAG: tRNA (guanosine(37)-N1)-methyltransferase TrmD [Acidobacteria bacterium]|nr:tRNA (guanosine(37)-N1)-methyltransferase TrmD [Acidobacteriota bacterium]MCI0625365.1 tRNA (guanosine(37)-N1)-methyltransferase TrmD [Acidobacteriota bacterium]MCI0720410.1 tRNA (guanosine(37)-N1)-methyltransferase TrmD [Acidobacteriota bacterium]